MTRLSQRFVSEDEKRATALQFAREVWARRRGLSEGAFDEARDDSYGYAEILEILAKVVKSSSRTTHYSLQTDVEMPRIEARGSD